MAVVGQISPDASAATLEEFHTMWRASEYVTRGGVAVSLDAVGSSATAVASISSLRPRGRHVQVGLLPSVAGLST